MARKPVSYLAGSVILGTAIGAVVALLATPKSGEDIRKTLRQHADDARQRTDELRQKVGEATRALPERLAQLPNQSRERFAKLPEVFKRQAQKADGGTPESSTQVTVEGDHAIDPPLAP